MAGNADAAVQWERVASGLAGPQGAAAAAATHGPGELDMHPVRWDVTHCGVPTGALAIREIWMGAPGRSSTRLSTLGRRLVCVTTLAAALYGAFVQVVQAQGRHSPVRASIASVLRDVATALNGAPVPVGGITQVMSSDGLRDRAIMSAGAGVVEVSARSHELDEAIFDGQLRGGHVQTVGEPTAIHAARTFAAAHFHDFGGLRLRTAQLVDHGAFSEYQFVWQALRGRAWLPVKVVVGLNVSTGQVAYFWSERGSTNVSTVPRISSATARQRAARDARISGDVQAGLPQLEVVDSAGTPQLVWVTEVHRVPTRELPVPALAVVWMDARTGKSNLAASDHPRRVRARPTAPRASGHRPGRARAASTLPTASCYDGYYYDGLSSRYSANHCAGALTQAGYAAQSYHNASAAQARTNTTSDAVFFFGGHAVSNYANGCQPTCSGPHQAYALLFESPDQNGNLDGLASNAGYSAQGTNVGVNTCADSGGCRFQQAFVTYPWGFLGAPEEAKANLVVMQACATGTAMTTDAHSAFVGTAIGFANDVSFPANADETGQFGDQWANTFWADLGGGMTYNAALVDAANSVGNQYGYNSWVELQNRKAPTSLYPAQYYTYTPVG